MTETVIDSLELALDRALAFDGNVMEQPVALFWPDKDRQWEPILGELQQRRRLVRYGGFSVNNGEGPAYWLRCVIAGTVEVVDAPAEVPIVYLGGVSRDEIRTRSSSATELAPLAGLQHRAQWFSHPNGKDWTIRAFLASKDRGLGLNVAGDEATATALVASLGKLIEQPITRLEGRYVDADYLNGLLNPDPSRALLEWIDDPAATRKALADGAWNAFVHHCKHELGFDPVAMGEIEAARKLGEAEGPWAYVWHRFRASAAGYPGIRDRLRQAQTELVPKNPGAWPALAEEAEDKLRAGLLAVADETSTTARSRVLELEEEHKVRRTYVWADIDWTPLVLALEHLAEVARITASAQTGSSVAEIADWYAATGWRADRAVLAALDEVDRKVDFEAVTSVLTALYRPWLHTAAHALQAAVGPAANAGAYVSSPRPQPKAGEAVAFVDGLRLDVAHLLEERLLGANLKATLSTGLAALPTVTQTAKPALIPIDQSLLGPGGGLDARRVPDGPPAGVQVLRGLMAAAAVQVLGPNDLGDPTGVAWTEIGDIDQRGHDSGVRLAHNIEDLVDRIARRIRELLDSGWHQITVVTDHGWLLLPGGLPKNENLPIAATDGGKKGRCARLKDGAPVDVPTVPWHWDTDVRIAVAPGIECFEKNQVYEHGGVSPQECVVPRLTVTSGKSPATAAEITRTKWRGLTFVVEFSGLPDGATIDLRTQAGVADSSVAELGRVTGGAGKAILLVENEDLEGQVVQLVVAALDGTLLLQRETTVGQNR